MAERLSTVSSNVFPLLVLDAPMFRLTTSADKRLAAISNVVRVRVEGSKAVVKRVTQTGYQTVECPLPAVVTIASGSFEAIYPTMKGIMGAKKKPFTQLKLADLGLDASQVGEAGAREQVVAIGKAEARAAGQIVKDEGNSAEVIVAFLQRYQLL